MKKLISVVLTLLTVLLCFSACGKYAPISGNTLRFTNRVKDMQKLDGQEITLTGYMSTLMPQKKYFFYLVSTPYDDTPFSGDHAEQMADTVAVYAKAGESFEYTDGLITVTGTLTFDEVTDSVGYSYSYRIKNASVAPASEDDLSNNGKKWQKLTNAGIVTELDKMYTYLEFVCLWPELTLSVDGEKEYFTPSLALYNIESDSASFSYGNKEGYFDSIIDSIKSVSEKDYSELIANIEKARELAEKAISALEKGEYTTQAEYSSVFGDGRQQYCLNDREGISEQYRALKKEYENWLESWKI